MPNLDLDLSQVREWTGNDPIPAGDYRVYISVAELATTQGGEQYFKACFTVTEGAYANRKIYDRFFAWSQKNPEPARQRLKALRRAIGLNPNTGGNTEEFINRELVVGVRVKKAWSGEGFENDVSSYKALGVAGPAGPADQYAYQPQYAQAPYQQQYTQQPAAQPQYAQPAQYTQEPVQQPAAQYGQPAPGAGSESDVPW